MTEPAAFTPSMRDLATRPYSDGERRVCDYLQKLMPDIGCGDDPIGFLIASHAAIMQSRDGIIEKEVYSRVELWRSSVEALQEDIQRLRTILAEHNSSALCMLAETGL